MTGVRGNLFQFCPNSDLQQLINEESVAKELERRYEPRETRVSQSSLPNDSPRSRVRSLSLHSLFAEADKLGDRFRTWSNLRSSAKLAMLARRICGEHENTSKVAEAPPALSFRKIFAILVLLEMPREIVGFLKTRVSDADLPLTGREVSGEFKLFRRKASKKMEGPGSQALERTLKRPLKCFRRWTPNRRREFEHKQWTVLAPYFTRNEEPSRNVCHYRLHKETILPFTLWEEVGHGGGFGQVFKVDMHSSHHSFDIPEVGRCIHFNPLPALSVFGQ